MGVLGKNKLKILQTQKSVHTYMVSTNIILEQFDREMF